MHPQPLLNSTGLQWDYQATPALKEVLRRAITSRYKNFQRGNIDESCIPFYLLLSGAGTGKSRGATEFRNTAIASLDAKDAELKTRLEEAWVFLVGFENGTSMRPEEIRSDRAIGLRMLLQLKGTSLEEVSNLYGAPLPEEVLKLVAKKENKNLKDATIILVVDGIHQLKEKDDDEHDPQSVFSRTLQSVGNLGHIGAFLLPVCTATIRSSIEDALSTSTRLRAFLPVPSLEAPTIRSEQVFPMTNSLVKLLVRDCGGHGRALEVLWNLLERMKRNGDHIVHCNVNDLLSSLRTKLGQSYRGALLENPNEIKALVRAVLLHQHLPSHKSVAGTDKLPGQFAAHGLISYDKSNGYLTMSYIWLWLMAQRISDAIPGWKIDDYSAMLSSEDKPLAHDVPWGNFERFIVRFRYLKSLLMEENDITSITEVHRGARLQGNIKFKNHQLNEPVCAIHQTATKTTQSNETKWSIQTTDGPTDVRKYKHIVMNACGASAGDSFLCLDTELVASVNEVHRYKSTDITQEDYTREREKAAADQDYFLLFTTQDKVPAFDLPYKSGIVAWDNWDSYFGPFAGRALFYQNQAQPNINSATFTELQMMGGITYEAAIAIEQEREKGPFSSIEDAETRLKQSKLSRRVLESFKWSQ